MKKILLFLSIITLCGCADGVLMSKHVKRSNGPIDGPTSDGSFSHEKAVYVEGNLEYLSDYKKRNNSLYFDSIKKNNKTNYKIAENYIKEYQRFLRVDADELENMIQSDQSGKSSAYMIRKMEAGELQKYPIKENIKAMQNLKDEKDKMAFPNYMDEYLNIKEKSSDDIGYIAGLDYDIEEKKIYKKTEDKIITRDKYVDFYFHEMNVTRGSNPEKYKEKSLLD